MFIIPLFIVPHSLVLMLTLNEQGPMGRRQTNMQNTTFDLHSQNSFARNPHTKRLFPNDLSSGIAEARTSARSSPTQPSQLLRDPHQRTGPRVRTPLLERKQKRTSIHGI
jgi:hypothetical protein